jgi:hypothetical protein
VSDFRWRRKICPMQARISSGPKGLRGGNMACVGVVHAWIASTGSLACENRPGLGSSESELASPCAGRPLFQRTNSDVRTLHPGSRFGGSGTLAGGGEGAGVLCARGGGMEEVKAEPKGCRACPPPAFMLKRGPPLGQHRGSLPLYAIIVAESHNNYASSRTRTNWQQRARGAGCSGRQAIGEHGH